MPILINEVKVHVPGDGIPIGNVVENADKKKKEKTGKFPRSRFISMNKLPRKPGTLHCSNCQMPIRKTVKDPIATGQTHFVAALMTPILLTWLPYVTTFSRDIVHRCPFCRVQLGVTVFRIIGKEKDYEKDYNVEPEQPKRLVQTRSIMHSESKQTIPLSDSRSVIIEDEPNASIPSIQLHKKQLTDRSSLSESKGAAAEDHPKTALKSSARLASSGEQDEFVSEKLASHLEATVREINSASASFFGKVGSVAESQAEHIMHTEALGSDENLSFDDRDLKANPHSRKSEEEVKSDKQLNPQEQQKPKFRNLFVPPDIAMEKPHSTKTYQDHEDVPRKRSGMVLSESEEEVKSDKQLNPQEQQKPEFRSLFVPPDIAMEKPHSNKTYQDHEDVPRKRSGMVLSESEEEVKSDKQLNPQEQQKPEFRSLFVPPDIAMEKPHSTKTYQDHEDVPRKRSGMVLSGNEDPSSAMKKEKPMYQILPLLARTRDGKIATTLEAKSSIEPVADTKPKQRKDHARKCKHCKKLKPPKLDKDEDRKAL